MKVSPFIWIPRILTLLYIAFLMLFSVDVFFMEGPLLQKVGGFLIHNVPAFLFLLSLAITWKQPIWTAGLVFVCDFIITLLYGTFEEWSHFLVFSIPPLFFALLFVVIYLLSSGAEPDTDGDLPAD